jgi:hypothetical protein
VTKGTDLCIAARLAHKLGVGLPPAEHQVGFVQARGAPIIRHAAAVSDLDAAAALADPSCITTTNRNFM